PDRLLRSTAQFIHNVFNTDVVAQSVYELGAMVSDEVPVATPLVLVLVTGYHASYWVKNLIKNTGASSSSVAMGS
ncbi:hypothetical protein EV368DRAFT_36286, partial [Lentinula lateritia]